MSEEEIIKILKKLQEDMSDYSSFMVGEFGERQIKAIQDLLDLYNKQKEEIEELKKPKFIMNAETGEITKIHNDFISKDKIREKINYLESQFDERIEDYNNQFIIDCVGILEELLEE